MGEVFVYGTLTDPDRAREVDPDATFGPDATLHGADRAAGRYPTLVPGDGPVAGRILRADLDALDAYEGVERPRSERDARRGATRNDGVDRGLYVRVSVPIESGGTEVDTETVETYVGDPDRLGVDAEWPGDGSLAARARAYLRERAVVRPERPKR